LRKAPDGIEGRALFERIYGMRDVQDNILSVHLCKMRKKLAAVGITIKNSGWGGWGGRGMSAVYKVRHAA
jgi:hypothetical protein